MDYVKSIGWITSTTGSIVLLCGILLFCLGFSRSGVVIGSVAATIQSMLGFIARNSIFAIFQSCGATGNLFIYGVIITVVGVGILVATDKYSDYFDTKTQNSLA